MQSHRTPSDSLADGYAQARAGSLPEARLLALTTAVPPFVLTQKDVAERASVLFGGRGDIERLLPVFANAGIERRYSCVPIGWYLEDHGWKERNRLFLDHAVALLEQAGDAAIRQAGLTRDAIDAIVINSTTGIATPSLDALLIERMGLRRDVARLPIFGFGCAGGVLGLTRAGQMARIMPGAHILFLTVELCALTFRRNDSSKSNLVAAALFGDGAAAAILCTEGDGPRLGAAGEYTWPGSLDVMGWDVEDDGLKARFSQSIPALVGRDFRGLAYGFADKNAIALKRIDRFALHPGGAKVLDALEAALDLAPGALEDSRAVLRDFGNMSAATVLFILARMRERRQRGDILMGALGPGFTAAFLMLQD